jgi:ABC-type multidrug transport system fused ATPase/permease subunit
MNFLPRVFRYVLPYRWWAAAVLLLIVASGLADLLAPWPLKVLVDHALGDHPLPAWLETFVGPADRHRLLWIAVFAGLGVALLHNALAVVGDYVQTRLEQRMVLDFRSDLFQHAQRLSLAFHDQKRSGMLIYAINGQGDAVAGMIMVVPAIGQSLITLLGMFWILLAMDWAIAVLSMAVAPFMYYSVRYYARHIQDRLMRVKSMEGESLSIVHESISMLRVIVAFGREPFEYRRFRDQGLRAVSARVDVTVRQTLFSLVVNMTTALGTAAVLGLGAYRVLEGKLLVGDLLVIMAYIAAVYKPMEAITHTIGTLQDKIASQRVAFNLLDTEPEIKEPARPTPLENFSGAVEFDAVCFSYQGRTDTLKDISFRAAPGQRVAIVGPTGAGKTTLISLLPRFYDPSAGSILLDGIDIRSLRLHDLREQISLVLQEPLLFSGTIADNIRYGRLDAGDDDVIEAARAANAHDFILRLPKQYETELGERGAKLSGGERQRLCVARAFLKNAPVLILDEPTSSIDSRTEAVILEALDRLMVGRTSFMIAHRLSTVHDADLMLVLDHGRLVQRGSHDELVRQEGLYRQLHEMQTRQGRRAAKSNFADSFVRQN